MTNILTVDTRECSSDATNFPAAVEHNGTSTLSARNRVTSAKPPGRERLYRSVSLLGPKVNPMSDADVVSIVSDAIRNRLSHHRCQPQSAQRLPVVPPGADAIILREGALHSH